MEKRFFRKNYIGITNIHRDKLNVKESLGNILFFLIRQSIDFVYRDASFSGLEC